LYRLVRSFATRRIVHTSLYVSLSCESKREQEREGETVESQLEKARMRLEVREKRRFCIG